jgi:hypothetical protein
MGILIGFAIYGTKRADVFAFRRACSFGGSLGEWVGLVLLAMVGGWMYRVGKSKDLSSETARALHFRPLLPGNGV